MRLCSVLQLFLLFFLSTLVSCSHATLQSGVKSLGYTPVALPSAEYRPGKVVRVVKSDPFVGTTVCSYDSYIGSPRPTIDNAATLEASQKLSGTFTLSADYLKQIEASANAEFVKNITLTLSKVTVEEIPNNAVYAGLSSQLCACTDAIKNASDPNMVGFLAKALKADVTYEITYENKMGLTVAAQKELLDGLALKLDASPIQNDGKDRLVGEGIYVGIMPPDPALVKTPQDGQCKSSSPQGTPDPAMK